MCKVNSSLQVKTTFVYHGPGHWVPNTDVYTTKDGLVAKVELAGMRPDNLRLVVEDNRLIIKGERHDDSRQPGIKFLVMEIRYGTFDCVLDLPAGYDLNQARANYQNGFLRVDVPLTKPARRVTIAVTDGR